jgi:hypothetical protein
LAAAAAAPEHDSWGAVRRARQQCQCAMAISAVQAQLLPSLQSAA